MNTRTESNRRNAMLSTGPRTSQRKAVVAHNAVKHGIYSALPVLPGVEREADWLVYRDGILHSLAPDGLLEILLAERVATLLWRLNRALRYETAMIQAGMEEVSEQLDPAPAPFPLASTTKPTRPPWKKQRNC